MRARTPLLAGLPGVAACYAAGLLVAVLGCSSSSPDDSSADAYPVALPLSGANCRAGTPLNEPLRARVLNLNGDPVSGTVATFSVATGDGQLAASQVTSTADGIAATQFTCGQLAGTATNGIVVAVGAHSDFWTLDGTSGRAVLLALQTRRPLLWDSVLVGIGTTATLDLSGMGVDQFDNTLDWGTPVSWSLTGGGTLTASQTPFKNQDFTDGCDASQFYYRKNLESCFQNFWTLGPTTAPGIQSVIATSVDTPQVSARFHVRVVPGPVHVDLTPASGTTVGVVQESTSSYFVITVTDAQGQPQPRVKTMLNSIGPEHDCSIPFIVEGESTLLEPCLTAAFTDGNGIIRFRVTADTIVNLHGIQVRVNVQPTPAVDWQVKVLPGAPTTLSASGGNNQVGTVSTPLGLPLTVRVVDAHHNRVPGVSITWTAGPGSGSATLPAGTTNDAGEASSTWTLGPGTGTQQMTAAIPGTGLSFTFAATASAP